MERIKSFSIDEVESRMAEIRSIISVAIISSVSHKLLTIKVIR